MPDLRPRLVSSPRPFRSHRGRVSRRSGASNTGGCRTYVLRSRPCHCSPRDRPRAPSDPLWVPTPSVTRVTSVLPETAGRRARRALRGRGLHHRLAEPGRLARADRTTHRAPGSHPAQLRRTGRAAARGHLRGGRSGDHRRLVADRGDHRDRRGEGARRRGARRVRHPGRSRAVDPAADHHADRDHRLDGLRRPTDRRGAAVVPGVHPGHACWSRTTRRSTSGSSRPPAPGSGCPGRVPRWWTPSGWPARC